MMNKFSNRRGFSLIELLIGIAIVAIIAGTAVHSYRQYQQKTQRLDGQLRLLEIVQLQQQYFSKHLTYTTELAQELNLTEEEGSVWSGKKIYRMSATSCNDGSELCVEVTATPKPGAADQQALSLDTLGRRTPAAVW